MAGLVPAIHVLLVCKKDVDARDNPRIKSGDGHDGEEAIRALRGFPRQQVFACQRPGTQYQGTSMPFRLRMSNAASERRKLTNARAVAASFALAAMPAE